MLKVIITISKRIPISGIDYSSTSASCTLEGEIPSGQDPAAESARLNQQAERVVDAQLKIVGSTSPTVVATRAATIPASTDTSNTSPSRSTTPGPNNARPAPSRSRRAMVTPAQLSLIDRLLRETRTDVGAVLQHYQVGALNQITCRDGSALITDLSSQQKAAR